MSDDLAPATPAARRTPVRYGLPVVRAFLARVAAGESQAQICRDPGMPTQRSVLYWVQKRPAFAKRLKRARIESGHTGAGGSASTCCPVTAQEIFRRLCQGESVTAICDDAHMPCFSTVYLWRRRFPEFGEMMRLAREIQAERFCELGWKMACEATPQTASLTRMQLGQLRWMVGHMAPRIYGRTKPVEADIPPPPEPPVVLRHFRVEERAEDGAVRVIAFRPNPRTRQVEREPGQDDVAWSPSPPGRWRRPAPLGGGTFGEPPDRPGDFGLAPTPR